ncbi:RICIN domain-containing protein [Leucobacter luti]|uniref:RICIN domain-containing protein n=1 Tax=Leucobacter luti TaxID=340320 RepID=UPI003D074D00
MFAFVAGVVVFGSLAGGGAAWGGWTADAGGYAWIETQRVDVEATSSDLDWKITNRHGDLARTGSVLVTNTGESAGEVALGISASGPLAEQLPVSIWLETADGCAFEPQSGVARGTWSAVAPPSPGRLEPGASARYCVRSAIDPEQRESIASAQGSSAADPVISASLVADGWGARSSALTVHQETSHVYPLAPDEWLPKTTSPWFKLSLAADPSLCLDIARESEAAGANAISWTCEDGANQYFRPLPVAGADNLVMLQPMHAPGMRVGVGGDGSQQLLLGASSQGSAAVQWYVQRISGNRVQLVSAVDGTCLQVSREAGNVARGTVDCSEESQLVMQQGVLEVSQVGWRIRIDVPAFAKSKTFTLFIRSGINWDPRGSLKGSRSKSITTDRAIFSGVHFAQIRDEDGNVIWDDLQFRVIPGGGVQPVKGFGSE